MKITNWSPTSSEFNNKGETSIVTAFILAWIIILPFWVLYKILKFIFKLILMKDPKTKKTK